MDTHTHSVCVCMYVSVYMCVCISIYIYVYVYVCVHVCMYINGKVYLKCLHGELHMAVPPNLDMEGPCRWCEQLSVIPTTTTTKCFIPSICDPHVLKLWSTKNYVFSINLDSILDRHKMNDFSTTKQMEPLNRWWKKYIYINHSFLYTTFLEYRDYK